MRRAAVVLIYALLLTACGASRSATGCLRIYFEDGASRSDIRAATSRLAHDERVVHQRFVSKRQALAEMKRKNPDLFENTPLPYNPLPDSLRVQTRDRQSARVLSRTIRSWPAVDTVKRPLSDALRKRIAKATGRRLQPVRCL